MLRSHHTYSDHGAVSIGSNCSPNLHCWLSALLFTPFAQAELLDLELQKAAIHAVKRFTCHEDKYLADNYSSLLILFSFASILRPAGDIICGVKQGLGYLLAECWSIVVPLLLQRLLCLTLCTCHRRQSDHTSFQLDHNFEKLCCILRVCNSFVSVSLYVSFLHFLLNRRYVLGRRLSEHGHD